MKNHVFYLCLAASFIMVSSAMPLIRPASAQSSGPLFRSYLSSTGSDSNPCTLQQPCRLLPAAIAQAQDGGEIWMLDSANYNTDTVTIDRNVTIQALPGVRASVLALNGEAIYIHQGYLTVTVRNIEVRSSGIYDYGIAVDGAESHLIMEDSRFTGNFGIAIYFFNANGLLTMSRSDFLGAQEPVFLSGTTYSLTANAVVDHCRFVGPIGNSNDGFETGDSVLTLSHSLVANYSTAISLSSSSVVLDDNVLVQNGTAVYVNPNTGGTAETLDNNTFFNNGENGAALTTLTSE